MRSYKNEEVDQAYRDTLDQHPFAPEGVREQIARSVFSLLRVKNSSAKHPGVTSRNLWCRALPTVVQ
ncbi:hypothetical protein [Bradyrhizobium sp. CCGB20]|uniref:hypothetical protein n=1 Tax=Bradyrhizobium sp. CCGB20 TaxID=2949633 RepID=UPI0020B25FC6|nr:hypothetical protein [Bradyrhizobium sp. CCGB20]MCP3401970.1 hypothetical protein [Bradyrhizobium sp. CCGB20]